MWHQADDLGCHDPGADVAGHTGDWFKRGVDPRHLRLHEVHRDLRRGRIVYAQAQCPNPGGSSSRTSDATSDRLRDRFVVL
jgi:hypothetical protein